MTPLAQLLFWLAGLAALLAGLWLLGPVLTPFIIGLVLAYFLDPVADRLESWGLPRLLATALILLVGLGLLVLSVVILLPLLVRQANVFIDNLPHYVQTLVGLFETNAPQWLKDAVNESAQMPDGESAAKIAAAAAGWLAGLLRSIISGSMALFNVLSLLVITPIVLFYMLNDWDRMVALIDGWLPRDHAETVRGIARDIDTAMAGFIRGQGTVALFLGAFYATGLILAGLNFGLLIGLSAGVLSFIPYIGTFIGGALAIGMALIQFLPDWQYVLLIAAIFAAGQFIEGNFLSPWLVGGRIGLHPVWMMFALVAFGYLFGFTGLLLAVPLAAALKVIIAHGLRLYLDSALYHGERRAEATEEDTPS